MNAIKNAVLDERRNNFKSVYERNRARIKRYYELFPNAKKSECAADLQITTRTVKNHLVKMLEEEGATNKC